MPVFALDLHARFLFPFCCRLPFRLLLFLFNIRQIKNFGAVWTAVQRQWFLNVTAVVYSSHLFVCQLHASWIIRECLQCNLQFTAHSLPPRLALRCVLVRAASSPGEAESSLYLHVVICYSQTSPKPSRRSWIRWQKQLVVSHVNHKRIFSLMNLFCYFWQRELCFWQKIQAMEIKWKTESLETNHDLVWCTPSIQLSDGLLILDNARFNHVVLQFKDRILQH